MRHIRGLLPIAATLTFSAFAFADSHSADPETETGYVLQNTYQFGAAFELVDAGSVSACRTHCDTDVRCSAWSFLPATMNGPERCEVKFSIGKSVTYPGAMSGLSARYEVTPIDMSSDVKLSGGPDELPSQPSAKTDPTIATSLQDPAPAPRIYRGNELAGPANIIQPPKDGEHSPLLPALRGN